MKVNVAALVDKIGGMSSAVGVFVMPEGIKMVKVTSTHFLRAFAEYEANLCGVYDDAITTRNLREDLRYMGVDC